MCAHTSFLALIDNLNLRNVKKGRFIIAKFYARIPNGENDVRRMYTLQTHHILD